MIPLGEGQHIHPLPGLIVMHEHQDGGRQHSHPILQGMLAAVLEDVDCGVDVWTPPGLWPDEEEGVQGEL